MATERCEAQPQVEALDWWWPATCALVVVVVVLCVDGGGWWAVGGAQATQLHGCLRNLLPSQRTGT